MAVPSTVDIFQAKSEPLAGLLPAIHDHKAALPNFQREWVWEPYMVRELVVSVANRYPAGSLLTMPNSGDTFALRPFSGSGTELSTTPNLMVLDGQQRLTSLYQALYSKDGIRDSSNGRHFLYLDIPKLTEHEGEASQEESTFEDCLFIVAVNKQGNRFRYKGLREYDDITTFEQEIEHGTLPLFTVFDADALVNWRDKYVDHQSGEDISRYKALLKEWEEEVAPWIIRIRDYRFPVIELNRDMELHAICHIFEKVNSTGVALTVFELCTAILWAQGLHLNDNWKETRDQLAKDQVLRMQGDLEGAMFLQVISLLSSLDQKRNAPDGRSFVRCRREDLLDLSAETVQKWWSAATMAYRDASKFMESQGILAQRILPYGTLLIPLAAIMGYLRSVKGEAQLGHAWPKIERWYWCSVFTQRYSSSVEASAALDFEQVVQWIEGGDEPEAVRTFNFPADRLQELSTIRSAIYKGILCLLARNGAMQFGGEGTLSVNLYYDSQQDHHHIFPLNALSHLGIKDWRANSIVNKTLIGASSNRSIGGRLPSGYLETMKSRMGDVRTQAILRSHLISFGALASDNWEDFYLTRREELRVLIGTACGRQLQAFTDGKRVSLPVQIQSLSESVGEIERRLRALIETADENNWHRIPEAERTNADNRIAGELRNNPGQDRSSFESVTGRLAFADLRSLEQIILNKSLWPAFSDVFGTKDSLAGRFKQLASFRNAIAHNREVDNILVTDAEVAILWFNQSLQRVEMNVEQVDLPPEEVEPGDIEEVTIEHDDSGDTLAES